MRKILIIAAMLAGVLTGCEKSRYPVIPEQPSLIQNTDWLATIPEVVEETEPGARVATVTPANAVFLAFKVTGSCSTSATSQKIAFYEGTITGTVAGTAVKTANGYSSTTIKSEKYNLFLKKKIDKTKTYTLLTYQPSIKSWLAIKTVTANQTTFGFVQYLKTGYGISCNSVTSIDLTTETITGTTSATATIPTSASVTNGFVTLTIVRSDFVLATFQVLNQNNQVIDTYDNASEKTVTGKYLRMLINDAPGWWFLLADKEGDMAFDAMPEGGTWFQWVTPSAKNLQNKTLTYLIPTEAQGKRIVLNPQ